MKLVVGMWMSFVVVGAACSKKDKPAPAPAAPAGSGSAVAQAPVAAPKPPAPAPDACPPGAYKPPSGAFCVDAPGFKGSTESKNGSFVSISLTPDNGPEVDIDWDTAASATDFDDRMKVMEDNTKLKGVTLEDHGDMPAGVTGKWVIWSSKSGPKNQFINRTFDSVTKGKKSNFNCGARWSDDLPPAPNVTTVCKSLHPLI